MESSETERALTGCGFRLLWVVACSIGLAVGFDVAYVLLDRTPAGSVIHCVIAGGLLGTALGIAQWFVLRLIFSGTGWWIIATIVGVSSGFVVGSLDIGSVIGLPLAIAVMGITQWLFLRDEVSGSALWVVANLCCAAIVYTAIVGVYILLYMAGEDFIAGLAGAVSGALYGAITGGVLAWLLQRSVAEEQDVPPGAS